MDMPAWLEDADRIASVVGATAGVIALAGTVRPGSGERADPSAAPIRWGWVAVAAAALLSGCGAALSLVPAPWRGVVSGLALLLGATAVARLLLLARRPLIPDPGLRALLTRQWEEAGRHTYQFFDGHVPAPPTIHVEQLVETVGTELLIGAAGVPGLLSIREVLRHETHFRHVLIVSGPGMGKSTLVAQVLREQSRWWLDARRGSLPSGTPLGPVVPVALPARLLAGRDLSAALAEVSGTAAVTGGPPAAGARWLIVIDGLDEVLDPHVRSAMINTLGGWLTDSPLDCRFLVTTRPLTRGELAEIRPRGVGEFALQPFSPAALAAFARNWFPPPDADRFLARISSARLGTVVSVPLLATIAAIVFSADRHGRLPSGRAELYERFVEQLVDGRPAVREQRERLRRDFERYGPAGERAWAWLLANRRALLAHLADAHLAVTDPAAAPDLERVAGRWVSGNAPGGSIEVVPGWRGHVRTLLTDTGVLTLQQGRLEFTHRSLAEYLAAEVRGPSFERASWLSAVRHPDTRNLALFVLVHSVEDIGELVTGLLAGEDDDVIAAGDVVADGIEVGAVLRDRVTGRLLACLTAAGPAAPEALRVLLDLAADGTVRQRLEALIRSPQTGSWVRVLAAAGLDQLDGRRSGLLREISADGSVSAEARAWAAVHLTSAVRVGGPELSAAWAALPPAAVAAREPSAPLRPVPAPAPHLQSISAPEPLRPVPAPAPRPRPDRPADSPAPGPASVADLHDVLAGAGTGGGLGGGSAGLGVEAGHDGGEAGGSGNDGGGGGAGGLGGRTGGLGGGTSGLGGGTSGLGGGTSGLGGGGIGGAANGTLTVARNLLRGEPDRWMTAMRAMARDTGAPASRRVPVTIALAELRDPTGVAVLYALCAGNPRLAAQWPAARAALAAVTRTWGALATEPTGRPSAVAPRPGAHGMPPVVTATPPAGETAAPPPGVPAVAAGPPAPEAPAATPAPPTPRVPVPVSGAPATGAPPTGVPVPTVPASGRPATGVPASGTPATGVPASGAPVSGAPMSGAPASGTPVPGVPARPGRPGGTVTRTAPPTGVPAATGAPAAGSPDPGWWPGGPSGGATPPDHEPPFPGADAPPADEPAFPGGPTPPDHEPPFSWGTTPPATVPGNRDRPPVILGPVPPRNPSFVGRTGHLARIHAAFTRAPGIVTLHGISGAGKSQIAAEYAHSAAADYEAVLWIPADGPATVTAHLLDLAERLGLPGGSAAAVLAGLPRPCLVVYDNATAPEKLDGLLPRDSRVLVTARDDAWGPLSFDAIEVDVLTRAESVAMLARVSPGIPPGDAHRLAERLGDLPLALDQAAYWRNATGMPVVEYLALVEDRLTDLLTEAGPDHHRTTLAATLELALAELTQSAPQALLLLRVLAHLGDAPVALHMLQRGQAAEVGEPLRTLLGDTLAVNRAVRDLRRFGLARVVDGRQVVIHRLMRELVRDRVPGPERVQIRRDVRMLLIAAGAGLDPEDPGTWLTRRQIDAHLDVAGLLTTAHDDARALLLDQCRFHLVVGDYERARSLAEAMVAAWAADDLDALSAMAALGCALDALGEHRRGRDLAQQAHDQLRNRLGEDSRRTLAAARHLGHHLRVAGDVVAALAADEDCLLRHVNVFGPEAAPTLAARRSLTASLRSRGSRQAAQSRSAQTARLWSRQAGEHDYRTRGAVLDTTWDLIAAGRPDQAVRILESTLPAFRDALGAGHDAVLVAERAHAAALLGLGRAAEALARATESRERCRARFGRHHQLAVAAEITYLNALRRTGRPAADRTGDGEPPAPLDDEVAVAARAALGETHPYTLALAAARILIRPGDFPAGELRIVHGRMAERLGDQHPDTCAAANAVGNELAAAQRDSAAIGWYERAHQTLSEVLGRRHPRTLVVATNLALLAGGHAAAIGRMAGVLGPDHPEVTAARHGRRLDLDIEPPPL